MTRREQLKWTAACAALGVVLVAVGYAYEARYVHLMYLNLLADARYWESGADGDGGGADEFPLDRIEAPLSIVKGDSKVLKVYLKNPSDKVFKEVGVAINAPAFETSPREVKRATTLPANKTVEVSWIITAKELGSHDITVDAGMFDHGSVTVSVTTVLGLTSGQAEFVKTLAYVFGPLLTVPFWLTLWLKKNEKKDQPAPPAPPKIIVP
jgi:hypothetical protein